MYKRLATVDNARQRWTTPANYEQKYAFVKRCSPGPAADRPGSASRQQASPGPPAGPAGPGRTASPHETRPGPPRTRPGPCIYSNPRLLSCNHAIMLRRCYRAYIQQYSQQGAGRIQQASRIQQAYSRLQECRPAGPCNMLSKKLSEIEKSACNMQSCCYNRLCKKSIPATWATPRTIKAGR
jgi:hypothetical protein